MSVLRTIVFAGSAMLMACAAEARNVRAPHQHRPASLRHTRDDGTADSTNWSGYAVTGANGSVTSVSGSWIVPPVTCPTAPTTPTRGFGRSFSGSSVPSSYASFWVGIDGWTSSTVEQIGTDSDCSSGTPTYYAWYEFYPQPSYYAGELTNLSPGDVIDASVTYNSNGTFTATIADKSKNLSYTTTFTPGAGRHATVAERSSAEWIIEAPSSNSGILPLANFGTIALGEDTTKVANTCQATVAGTTATIGGLASVAGVTEWQATMITESGSTTKALPSSLSADGSSFTETWLNAGP